MRDLKRIPTILKQLEKLWKKSPDMRLIQLIAYIANTGEHFPKMFYMEDDELLKSIEYAMRDKTIQLRKPLKNENFRFTKKNVQRLDVLNKFFLERENEAYKQAAELEEYALSKSNLADTFVQDYEIEFHIGLYTETKYLDEYQLSQKVDNTPFYEDTWGIHYVKKTSKNAEELKFREDWRKQNHNEFQHQEHPLKNQHHCYLFHHIYHHTLLAWEDILRIEQIWIDVILSVQNNVMVNLDSKGKPVPKWEKPDYTVTYNDIPLKKK